MGYFWGPMFPDYRGGRFSIPPVAAELSLAPTVTNSGALDNMKIQARAPGTAGNGIQVRFVADALVDTGDLEEDTGLGQVTVRFVDAATRVSDLVALINVNSTLVQITGTYNPSDTLAAGDDEFAFLDLEHGVDQVDNVPSLYWGPHFPDAANTQPVFIPGTGPDGVATFALALEACKLTFEWATDIFKAYDGKEQQRHSILDDPKQRYSGLARLAGTKSIALRNEIYRYASLGSTFLLALPFEELTISGLPAGLSVPVYSTARADWANIGQRVVVLDVDGNLVGGVIQDVIATSIDLDVDTSSVCRRGSHIMPVVPVYLDPQQGFARYPHPTEAVEEWSITAVAATLGFRIAAVAAELALGDPLTVSGAFDAAILRARSAGAAGNAITVTFVDDALVSTGEYEEDGTDITVRFVPGDTTAGQLRDLINTASSLITMVGLDSPNAVLQSIEDEFAATALTGGSDESPAEMGRGASIATVFDRPLWDRGVDVSSETSGDSIQAMNEIIDMGAAPVNFGTASFPDSGRAIAITRTGSAEWQWLKLFISTVRASQKAFWLPTFRNDLLSVGPDPDGGTTGEIVIDSSHGDFDLWFSRGYDKLEIVQDGAASYAQITDSNDNGDGTITLTIETDPDDPGAALGSGSVERVSWLELCRFEHDEFNIAFKGTQFSMTTSARVVQQ